MIHPAFDCFHGFCLMVLLASEVQGNPRESRSILYRDYVGPVFPYSLLSTRKEILVRRSLYKILQAFLTAEARTSPDSLSDGLPKLSAYQGRSFEGLGCRANQEGRSIPISLGCTMFLLESNREHRSMIRNISQSLPVVCDE